MSESPRLPRTALRDTSWHERAQCRGEMFLFFAPEGERGPEREARVALAKEFCAVCPVVSQCLAWALATATKDGIWGGLDEEEREAERQRMLRRVARGRAA